MFINVRIYSIPSLLAADTRTWLSFIFSPFIFTLYSFLFFRKELVKEIREVIKIPVANFSIHPTIYKFIRANLQMFSRHVKKIVSSERKYRIGKRTIFLYQYVHPPTETHLWSLKVYVKMFARFYLSPLFPPPLLLQVNYLRINPMRLTRYSLNVWLIVPLAASCTLESEL